MEMIAKKQCLRKCYWNYTNEKSAFEAVEALMSMSCSWKSDFKKYAERRPMTPASDTSEEFEDNVLPPADFRTIPAFVSFILLQITSLQLSAVLCLVYWHLF